jgi:hypothetical protein
MKLLFSIVASIVFLIGVLMIVRMTREMASVFKGDDIFFRQVDLEKYIAVGGDYIRDGKYDVEIRLFKSGEDVIAIAGPIPKDCSHLVLHQKKCLDASIREKMKVDCQTFEVVSSYVTHFLLSSFIVVAILVMGCVFVVAAKTFNPEKGGAFDVGEVD